MSAGNYYMGAGQWVDEVPPGYRDCVLGSIWNHGNGWGYYAQRYKGAMQHNGNTGNGEGAREEAQRKVEQLTDRP